MKTIHKDEKEFYITSMSTELSGVSFHLLVMCRPNFKIQNLKTYFAKHVLGGKSIFKNYIQI